MNLKPKVSKRRLNVLRLDVERNVLVRLHFTLRLISSLFVDSDSDGVDDNVEGVEHVEPLINGPIDDNDDCSDSSFEELQHWCTLNNNRSNFDSLF